jgi:hypothetical protein
MKLALVNSPRSQFDCEELAPPLGLIRLSQVALRCGWQAVIEDYNLLWHLDPELRRAFYEAALERLLEIDASIYGFTSMAVDSHIALELSRRLKQARPDCKVILGGSHFSAIAEHVKGLYPWIDMVLCGEAEQALAELLKPGVRINGKDLQIPLDQLNQLHLPAYFYINPRHMVNLEAGRGCIFKCAFCYSPGHYREARNFPIQQVLDQVNEFPTMGIRHVWFVEDNFLNNPDHAKNLCNELARLRCGITWSCYATFPQLSEDVIEMMGQAGCTEVFCGIDAVGSAAERAFQKAFLRGTNPITTKIQKLTSAGIKPTFAFLVAPPSHAAGTGYDDTVDAALEAQAAGAYTLLNPLSLYTGTVAYRKAACHFELDTLQAQMMMDLPEVAISNPFAADHPELYPFHSRYVDSEEWRSFLAVTRCVSTLIHCFPLALTTAQKNAGIHPREIAQKTLLQFDGWASVPKEDVRDVERDVGYAVLEELSEEVGINGLLKTEYGLQSTAEPIANECSKMEQS